MKYRKANLVGKKYGLLTVTAFAGTDAWGKSEWSCQCDCGQVVVVGISSLNQKHTKSCGCFRKTSNYYRLWKGYGEISGDYWSTVQRNAKSRNIEFSITIEYAWDLFLIQNKKCKLSGLDISLYRHHRNHIRPTASLDRIDNNKGYIVGNVQWVHKHLNICKHTYSNEEFIEICNMVANLHPREAKPKDS
jgi:hypothetical protein